MLLKYFGFQEEPFGITPDPRFLYLSHTHREALASMEYGFQSNRGFIAMIAPPGMGKTTLLYRFLQDARETVCSVFLFDIDADCTPREFLGYVLHEIGMTPGQSDPEMHEQLRAALIKEARAGRKFVVVIDEAQNLSDAVLERVRLLTNLETTRGKLLHIVLSGQPQLSDKLMNPSLTQLRQRISIICRLEPLSPRETVSYIDYRIKRAGYDGEPLFTTEALRQISEASQGIPRTINNLCFSALSLCRALGSRLVDGDMAAEVIADLQLIQPSTEPISAAEHLTPKPPSGLNWQPIVIRPLKRRVPVAAVLLVLCVLGGLWLAGFLSIQSRKRDETRSLSQKVLPAQVRAPTTVEGGKVIATESAPKPVPFAIRVKPNQRLADISLQYLGGFDLQRLHQIQALNPKLTNPDHIEIGQTIWLPGPPPPMVAKDASLQQARGTYHEL